MPRNSIWRGSRKWICVAVSVHSLSAGLSSASSLTNAQFMAVYYVAVNGHDSQSGTAEAPFATLERARDEVRKINGQMTGDILVGVAPGDYFLQNPFRLRPEDSGNNGFRVRYQGLGKPGKARLIGAKRLTEWEPAGSGIYRAEVGSGHVFHTLYENGIRARKARFPNYEFDTRFPLSGARYLTAEDGTGAVLTWKAGDLDTVISILETDLSGANLVVWPWSYADWHKATRKILEIDRTKRTIRVEDSNPAIGKEARFYVEGARELLDRPGEFYLDAAGGYLYYWPRFGDPSKQEIFAPVLTRIISLEGEQVDNPVRDLVISGFTAGFTDTFSHMEGTTMFPWSETSAGAHGTIHLRFTEEVEILSNHITGSGMNGVYLERSNKRNRIAGNWIEDCGISGVVLAYHRESRKFPRDVNEENLIENNRIHYLGSIAVDSAGVNRAHLTSDGPLGGGRAGASGMNERIKVGDV